MAGNYNDDNGAAAAMKELLSGKDKCAEELVKSIAQSVVDHSRELAFSEACERRAAAATGTGADDLQQFQLNLATERLSKISPVLANRYGVLLKTHLAFLQDQTLQDAFAEIRVPELPIDAKSLIYQRMFDNFVDDADSVSFATHNKSLLGNLNPKDMFVLLMFTFATCRRVKGDNLLQLIVSGVSSVGKSKLFESAMLHGGHNFATEEGVGRFVTGKKNLLLLHDVDISILYSGKDSDKIKAIARSETTSAKVQNTVTIILPLFIFCSSNMNLMTHVFSCRKGGFFTKKYESQAQLVGQKRRHEECLNAIKSRFLELFVRKAPWQDPEDLKNSDNFNRTHFILATYERVVAVMAKYKKEDFHSTHLIHYVASGLCKFADLHTFLMKKNLSGQVRTVVANLCPADFIIHGNLPEEDICKDESDRATPVPSLADRPDCNWFDSPGFDNQQFSQFE